MKVTVLFSALSLAASVHALWPIPTIKYEHGDKPMWLMPDVTMEFKGKSSTDKPSKQIKEAWQRVKNNLFEKNIVPWKLHPKFTGFEPAANTGIKIKKVIIKQSLADVHQPAYSKLKENYRLEIPLKNQKDDTVFIFAQNSLGAMHALTSLEQLFYATKNSKGASSPVYGFGPVMINDNPKFPHRGVNMDVSRQWYPKETIYRVLDAMSWNKLNRLHLHATDSQSWPLEIPKLPELAAKGSYAEGLTYTPKDLQDILNYADLRGIKVIVEIDMPGHTTSIADAFPDLIVGRNIQPNWDTYAAQPPSGSLKLNNPAVNKFLGTLMDDLLPRLNKHTNMFHTGGDEVNSNVYELDPGVGSKEPTKIQPHLQKFSTTIQNKMNDHGMKRLVWEEMLLDWNITMPKDTIVQTWRSDEATKKSISKGYRVLGGNYNFWYLDCGHGQWLDFTGPAVQKYFPYSDYCSPRKNWRLIYSYSPDQGLTAKEAKSVLGGEVHVWSEQIDSSSIDVMMWPRTSAAAEVLWSGNKDIQGKNRTFPTITPRLGEMRERMLAKGVNSSPVTQLWCLQNKNSCGLDH